MSDDLGIAASVALLNQQDEQFWKSLLVRGLRQFRQLDDGGRRGMRTAVQALVMLAVRSWPRMDWEQLQPVLALCDGLDDLEFGNVHPALKPSPISNRPRDRAAVRDLKVRSLVAAEILRKYGNFPTWAAADRLVFAHGVGCVAASLALKPHGNMPLSAKCIGTWRDTLQKTRRLKGDRSALVSEHASMLQWAEGRMERGETLPTVVACLMDGLFGRR